jgi:hypothetical protein
MKHGPIYIKSIFVKQESAGQARIDATLLNRSRESVPSFLLLLYFYDAENRIRDRISIRLKPFAPAGVQSVSSIFRLKSGDFFSYTARLEKLEGTDYSNFEVQSAE